VIDGIILHDLESFLENSNERLPGELREKEWREPATDGHGQ